MTPAIEHGSAPPIAHGTWRVDPERSEVGFAAKSMWGLTTVRGAFGSCQGSLTLGARAVSGDLAIDASSVDTGNRRRGRHLCSPDFLDTERHPRIVFRLGDLTSGDRALTVAGALRIGDSDTEVELPIDVEQIPGDAVRLHASATISRAAAGVTWNWLGMIPDDTSLYARITLVPAPDASWEPQAS
jgi:polyisoprenoid-binding protein YceI